MPREFLGSIWNFMPRQVVGARAGNHVAGSQHFRNETGISQAPDPNGNVNASLNQINVAIVEFHLHADVRVSFQVPGNRPTQVHRAEGDGRRDPERPADSSPPRSPRSALLQAPRGFGESADSRALPPPSGKADALCAGGVAPEALALVHPNTGPPSPARDSSAELPRRGSRPLRPR